MASNDENTGNSEHFDRIVELINTATLTNDKVPVLTQIQEVLIHRDPNLLDNFLDEVLAFQHDPHIDVKKWVIGFIEEICKYDPDFLPKVVANLSMMIQDENVNVQKKVIQTATQLYRVALKWLCDTKQLTDIMVSAWDYICNIKGTIITLIDHDNDGIRTQAIKFMEMLVLTQTFLEADVNIPKKNDLDLNLSDVPLASKFAKRRQLEDEAKKVLEVLIVFHGSPHISSVNLMTCMGTLTTIGRARPSFLSKIIQAFETVHVNLPPTLAKSQVSSVRKHLKLQLLSLIKQPASIDFHSQMTTLLVDLGATQHEIMKSMPKTEELRKRAARAVDTAQPTKKPRLGDGWEDDEPVDKPSKRSRSKPEQEMKPKSSRSKPSKDSMDHVIAEPSTSVSNEEKAKTIPPKKQDTAIDITADFISPLLGPDKVIELIMAFLPSLPAVMPAHFQSNYTPIAAAGTSAQIKHMARMLATQMTAAGIGPGIEEINKRRVDMKHEEEESEQTASTGKISVIGGNVNKQVKEQPREEKVKLMPTGMQPLQRGRSHQIGRKLKLEEITKPLTNDFNLMLLTSTVERILNADSATMVAGALANRTKIICTLAVQLGSEVAKVVECYILDDVRNRLDLAISWLFSEYAVGRGMVDKVIFADDNPANAMINYDWVLCGLLVGVLERRDVKDMEAMFTRVFLDAPIVTEQAVDILKTYCRIEPCAQAGAALVRELVVKRSHKQLLYLNILLELTVYEHHEIRNHVLAGLKELLGRPGLNGPIQDYGRMYLQFLQLPEPPGLLFGEHNGRPDTKLVWTEELMRLCLNLFMVVLPTNHKLINDLMQVYVSTTPEVKRVVLRMLDAPIKAIGVESPELMALVEKCPKGAETLIMRVIHIVTDKVAPSAELVSKVRDIYYKRIPDVRFLIPVIAGLTKKEVIGALPKLLQLNPAVMKEGFNRLLGTHSEAGENYTSPLTPADLLVALHNIESDKCDVKTVMKATSLCFAERNLYTQEVLALVLQQLMEQPKLPTLLMRTVIQSVALYPRLVGFVMNILQRLILKQVWTNKKVWEGFIRCCQRIRPQSFQVLLQLPPPQLQDVFHYCPEMRQPLLTHVMSLTDHQRAHIPLSVMDVLHGVIIKQEVVEDMYLDQPDESSSSNMMEGAMLPAGLMDLDNVSSEIDNTIPHCDEVMMLE